MILIALAYYRRHVLLVVCYVIIEREKLEFISHGIVRELALVEVDGEGLVLAALVLLAD